MAPRKSIPLSTSKVKNNIGITFSFKLIPVSESADVLVVQSHEPRSITRYALQPDVHTISSVVLNRRMRQYKKEIGSISMLPKKVGPGGTKKRKTTSSTTVAGECVWCGTHKTAQWRKGPNGARSLCNRCGIEWAKQIKTEAKDLDISIFEAESKLIEQFKAGERIHRYQRYVGDSVESPDTANIAKLFAFSKMAMPYRIITANHPDIPKLNTLPNPLTGLEDPSYVYTSKQIPYFQLTRLLDQISDFATFSNELFANLANETIGLDERITKLQNRVKDLGNKLPELEQEWEKQEMKSFHREKNIWLSNHATQNSFISAMYETCYSTPALQKLDEFRTDGKSSVSLFSYPEFFVDEWKILLQKDQDGKKAKKKKEEENDDIQQEGESMMSPSGVFITTPVKQGRERIMVDATEPVPFQLAKNNLAQVPKAAPPPPPPPPPLPFTSTPTLGTFQIDSPSISKNIATSPNDVNGFLGDIRGKQFVLRKTQMVSKEERKKQNEPDEVVAILMRRAALEASDSDPDEDEDQEWT